MVDYAYSCFDWYAIDKHWYNRSICKQDTYRDNEQTPIYYQRNIGGKIMSANINTIEDKLNFYKNAMKNKTEMFVLICNGSEVIPICVYKTNAAETGYAEMKCQLLGPFTFDKTNKQQQKFMAEQGYYIHNDRAYDIQPTFVIEPFDKYFGSIDIIEKTECIKKILNK